MITYNYIYIYSIIYIYIYILYIYYIYIYIIYIYIYINLKGPYISILTLSSCFILTIIATILKNTFDLHSQTQTQITTNSGKWVL